MKEVKIEEKAIYGISVRTKNADEINPETAKIGNLWQKFDHDVPVDYQGGERVYGVYYNYESDVNGEYDILAGIERRDSELVKAVIQKGKYLVFGGRAKSQDDNGRIQAVIETWGKVWEYFGREDAEYRRAYTTDFEYYKNQSEIEIYISVK